jgi:glycosyltransferase involved in cell wall biosynthesis
MSEDDKDFIVNKIGEAHKVTVVANGVDTRWFADFPDRKTATPTILSVGTFKWLPNVEAVQFLVNEVWPRIKMDLPKVRLWIVGNAPTDEVLNYQKRDAQIKVTGNLPDIRDAFKGAWVLAAPIFSGKGTRYKILEAMASGTPIVATTTAVEGLEITSGKQAIIADSAQEMAEQIVLLIKNQNKQKMLAENGMKYVAAHFDWDRIAGELDKVYLKI